MKYFFRIAFIICEEEKILASEKSYVNIYFAIFLLPFHKRLLLKFVTGMAKKGKTISASLNASRTLQLHIQFPSRQQQRLSGSLC